MWSPVSPGHLNPSLKTVSARITDRAGAELFVKDAFISTTALYLVINREVYHGISNFNDVLQQALQNRNAIHRELSMPRWLQLPFLTVMNRLSTVPPALYAHLGGYSEDGRNPRSYYR